MNSTMLIYICHVLPCLPCLTKVAIASSIFFSTDAGFHQESAQARGHTVYMIDTIWSLLSEKHNQNTHKKQNWLEMNVSGSDCYLSSDNSRFCDDIEIGTVFRLNFDPSTVNKSISNECPHRTYWWPTFEVSMYTFEKELYTNLDGNL